MIYCYDDIFIRSRTCFLFVVPAEDDDALESFFLGNILLRLGRTAQQIETFQLLLNCYLFLEKYKKSISYGCMGTDQGKTTVVLKAAGWPGPAFCL